ncbi:MAG: pyridoxamine kinase [Ruminococcus sp.]|nr:pyridoxamine kinase [Ruminococcus sp.]MBR7007388.1 pyridoxamine kinase [Ruminococcus sp.]
MKEIKKVAAIQDLSGIGRCSLTVIIPVLSAMGVQVCPVPTAVLSAHTGYGEFVMHDLTDFMMPALEHYKKLNVGFDCVYSGFLASSEQIDHCLEFFSAFPNALKLVDPVMGDDGKAYATYTPELCARMSELVAVADIITPNLTEAAILLGEDYPEGEVSEEKMKSWLVRLSDMGAQKVVITSVTLENGQMATVGYNKANGSFCKLSNSLVPAHYSGTGDMFASVLIGSLLNGKDLSAAMSRAADFTEHTLRITYEHKRPWTDGLMFEGELGELVSDNGVDRCVRM